MERRGFFRSLVAGGATVTNSLAGKPLKHRREPISTATYHGPMEIPSHVAEIVREDPALHRVRGGGKDKLAARYAADGVVWLFRCRVPDHRQMVGDVRRTADGWRVCCWSAATPAPTIPPAERLMDSQYFERLMETDLSDLNVPKKAQLRLSPHPLDARRPAGLGKID